MGSQPYHPSCSSESRFINKGGDQKNLIIMQLNNGKVVPGISIKMT